MGSSPPMRPIGTTPRYDDRSPPSWGSNLLEIKQTVDDNTEELIWSTSTTEFQNLDTTPPSFLHTSLAGEYGSPQYPPYDSPQYSDYGYGDDELLHTTPPSFLYDSRGHLYPPPPRPSRIPGRIPTARPPPPPAPVRAAPRAASRTRVQRPPPRTAAVRRPTVAAQAQIVRRTSSTQVRISRPRPAPTRAPPRITPRVPLPRPPPRAPPPAPRPPFRARSNPLKMPRLQARPAPRQPKAGAAAAAPPRPKTPEDWGYDPDELAELGLTEADMRSISLEEEEERMSPVDTDPIYRRIDATDREMNRVLRDYEKFLFNIEKENAEDIARYGHLSPSRIEDIDSEYAELTRVEEVSQNALANRARLASGSKSRIPPRGRPVSARPPPPPTGQRQLRAPQGYVARAAPVRRAPAALAPGSGIPRFGQGPRAISRPAPQTRAIPRYAPTARALPRGLAPPRLLLRPPSGPMQSRIARSVSAPTPSRTSAARSIPRAISRPVAQRGIPRPSRAAAGMNIQTETVTPHRQVSHMPVFMRRHSTSVKKGPARRDSGTRIGRMRLELVEEPIREESEERQPSPAVRTPERRSPSPYRTSPSRSKDAQVSAIYDTIGESVASGSSPEYDREDLAELGLTEADLADINMDEVDDVMELRPEDMSVPSDFEYEEPEEFRLQDERDQEMDRKMAHLALVADQLQAEVDAMEEVAIEPAGDDVMHRMIELQDDFQQAMHRLEEQKAALAGEQSPAGQSGTEVDYSFESDHYDPDEETRILINVQDLYDRYQPDEGHRVRTPPVFSDYPEIREAGRGLRYTAAEMEVNPMQQWQHAPDYMAGEEDLDSPRRDHRLGNRSIPSPGYYERLNQEAHDLSAVSPGLSGVPVSSPRPSPSPRRSQSRSPSRSRSPSPARVTTLRAVSPGEGGEYDAERMRELGLSASDMRDIDVDDMHEELRNLSGQSEVVTDEEVEDDGGGVGSRFDDWAANLAQMEADLEAEIAEMERQ